MQCNFIFYLFVTSSLFFLEVVVKIFDYFWKSYSLFSKFCVNCLLMFYFVYCKNCALLPMFVRLPFQLFPQKMIGFRQDCITCDAGNFTCSSQVKSSFAQFTCVTCSLPVNTVKFTCFEAASTSHRLNAIAINKARKLRVTSPAWCRLTYLQFAGEFSRGVMAGCLQLQVFLRGIAGFLPAFGGYFYLRFQCFCL